MKIKKILKIYLWFIVILFPIILAFEIFDGESSDFLDYLDYVFWATALLGVFGYCYEKKILFKNFWKVFLPFVVIWDIFIGFRDIQNDPELSEPIAIFFILFLVLIFVLPEYIGLYIYGYKENKST